MFNLNGSFCVLNSWWIMRGKRQEGTEKRGERRGETDERREKEEETTVNSTRCLNGFWHLCPNPFWWTSWQEKEKARGNREERRGKKDERREKEEEMTVKSTRCQNRFWHLCPNPFWQRTWQEREKARGNREERRGETDEKREEGTEKRRRGETETEKREQRREKRRERGWAIMFFALSCHLNWMATLSAWPLTLSAWNQMATTSLLVKANGRRNQNPEKLVQTGVNNFPT